MQQANMPEILVVDLEAFRKAERVDGSIKILAIDTSTSPNVVDQSIYTNNYFKITNIEHMTQLKEKFKSLRKKLYI